MSVLECRCPAEFSSNPNQTHLNQTFKVFRITRATGEVFSGLELNSEGVTYPCARWMLGNAVLNPH